MNVTNDVDAILYSECTKCKKIEEFDWKKWIYEICKLQEKTKSNLGVNLVKIHWIYRKALDEMNSFPFISICLFY